jgi:hypothetical protein
VVYSPTYPFNWVFRPERSVLNLATLVCSSAASSMALLATFILIYFNLLITTYSVSGSNVVENSTRERRGLPFPFFFIFSIVLLISIRSSSVSTVVSPSGATL